MESEAGGEGATLPPPRPCCHPLTIATDTKHGTCTYCSAEAYSDIRHVLIQIVVAELRWCRSVALGFSHCVLQIAWAPAASDFLRVPVLEVQFDSFRGDGVFIPEWRVWTHRLVLSRYDAQLYRTLIGAKPHRRCRGFVGQSWRWRDI